jgi:dihydrofolate synthase/folylpolyglutamate synthase
MLAGAVRDMKNSYRRLVLVLGILGDKDYRGIVSELVPLADHVIVTKPEYSRAMDVSALSSEVRTLHGSVETAETVRKAIVAAQAIAAPDDLILITGSLYVVGDARTAIVGHDLGTQALSGLKG